MIIQKTYTGSQTRQLLPKEKNLGGVIGDARSTILKFNLPKGYTNKDGWTRYVEFDCYVTDPLTGKEMQPIYALPDSNQFIIPAEIAANNVGKIVSFNLKFVKKDDTTYVEKSAESQLEFAESADGEELTKVDDTTIIEKSLQGTLYFMNSPNGEGILQPMDVITLLYNTSLIDAKFTKNTEDDTAPVDLTFLRYDELNPVQLSLPIPYLENGKIPPKFMNKTIVVDVLKIASSSELTTLAQAEPPDMALVTEGSEKGDLYILTDDDYTQVSNWLLVHTDNLTLTSLNVVDSVDVGGDLTIGGDEAIEGSVIVGIDLTVDGSILVEGTTDLRGDIKTKFTNTPIVIDVEGKVAPSVISTAELNNLTGSTENVQNALGSIRSDVSAHILDKTNPHSVTKTQVGLGNVDNTADMAKPISTATQNALDTISNTLNAHKEDTSNPHSVTKAQVGLGNADNTADLDKPISTATQKALDTITSDFAAHKTDTSNPHKVTKAQVGLGSVDNTSDVDKPISAATQSALDELTDSIDTHKADKTNPHEVTKAQVGLSKADNTADVDKPISKATQTALDTITTNLSTHTSDISNPHKVTKAQVGLGNVDNTSDANKPISTATQKALDTTNSTINTHIANKSNPHSVTKAQVGLGNADNTSDADKPISTATQDALDTITGTIDAHTTNISNPHEVTKEQVGLGNVDNTADVDKPISKATQTALDTITTNLSTHTGDTSNPHEVTKEQVGLGKADNTADVDKPISKATQTALNTLTTSIDTHKADTTNPHKVTKAQVGLSNVDNTADLDKPISTATEKELNIVAFSLSSHTRDEYNPHNVTKAQVGLSNVDNTADLDKPISTLTQDALDAITSDLSAHTADKTNPHSVTKAQVGLGSADNTADAVKNVLSAAKLTTGRKIGISGVTATTQTFDGTKDITIPVTAVPSSLLTGTISDERIPELAISKITDLQDELDSKALDSTLTTHIGDVSNPHKVTKVQVGLSDVDNTSDLAKPISTATQTALDKKADKTSLDTHTANTSNPHKVTKAQLGLGNVDNTSDADKPISTATQTALDTHTDSINAVTTDLATHLADEDNPHKVTKAQLGLGNVDNTSDLNKPISTATQTALNKKVDAVAGKGLSTNDYTTAEKNKLSGIDVGAEVNVIEGIQVDGVDQTLTNKKYNLKTTGTAYPSTAGNDAVALKGFVNSSINAIAAFYITKNAAGDPFTSNAELTSATTFYSGGEVRTPTRNDYCIVLKDEVNGGETAGSTRYIYDNGWEFQYSLNYQFTQAQMDALNSGINGNKTTQISANQSAIATINNSSVMKSGITSALVGQIGTNKTNIESLTTRIGTAEGEIDSLQSGKQDKLSDTQTAAINSGITKTIVGQISTNAGNITALQNGKQDKLSDTQTAAINSGITESLVKQINTNKTDIAALDGRADDCETAIGTANTNISNNTSAIATINESAVMTSGITSAKVTQIQTNTNNIANKVDKVTGKGLSTNDYTTDEKNKLSGIESKAQVNKLEAIKVNGVAQTITDKTVDLSITSSTLWGEIGGTLSDQTDLNDELTTINGNITTVSDNLSTHTADTSNPHKVTKAQIGLGNVDNTSDANKPISTATQTALNKKVDAVAGKGLSTNDFTGAYKTKLDGIDSGAEVNVIETVKVDGTALTVTGKAVNIDLSGKASATTVSSHISNTSNPHSVTKAQVGLGNVDNTSDANKPISTATQTALNNKVTKSSTASVIYGTNSSKADTTYALSTSVSSSSTDSQIPTAKAVQTVADTKLDKTATSVKTKGLLYLKPTVTTSGSLWSVTTDEITELYEGLMIAIRCPEYSKTGVKLQVNEFDSATIVLNSTSSIGAKYAVNSVMTLVYRPVNTTNYWAIMDDGNDNNSQVRQYQTTADTDYPIITRYNTADKSGTYEQTYVRFDTKAKLNHSTGAVKSTELYSTTSGSYPLLFSSASDVSSTANRELATPTLCNTIYADPSTGKVTATEFDGKVAWSNVDSKPIVTTWSSATSDTNIPSEKLVKSGLDAKANANSITASSVCKLVSYNAQGIITGSSTIGTSNLPTIPTSKISGLSAVATSGSYSDLSNKPTIPTVDSTMSSTSTNPVQNKVIYSALSGKQDTLTKGTDYVGHTATASIVYGTNSSKVDTNYALSTATPSSASTDTQIPTAKAVYNGLSSKQNTLSYSLSTATPSSSSTDTQVPSSKAVYTALSNKQDKLTSGTNIKTINSNSLLGSGNIAVQSTLSSTQLAACNSGITSTKVSKYDAYDDSKQDRIILTSAVVDWESDTTYTSLGFTYKGTIYVNGCTSSHSANVTFDLTTATSGKVAPICETDTDAVYVWAKENLGSISVDVAVIPGQ